MPVTIHGDMGVFLKHRVSPTAVNFQPQRILVIRDKASVEKLKRSTNFTFNAPVILMVCYDISEAWKDPFECIDIGTVDATIVATQMMLEAADLDTHVRSIRQESRVRCMKHEKIWKKPYFLTPS